MKKYSIGIRYFIFIWIYIIYYIIWIIKLFIFLCNDILIKVCKTIIFVFFHNQTFEYFDIMNIFYFIILLFYVLIDYDGNENIYKQRLIFINNKKEMKESEYEWFVIKLEEYLLIIRYIQHHVVARNRAILWNSLSRHTYYTEEMVVWLPKDDEINTFYKKIKHHYLYYIFHTYFYIFIFVYWYSKLYKLIYIFIKLSKI